VHPLFLPRPTARQPICAGENLWLRQSCGRRRVGFQRPKMLSSRALSIMTRSAPKEQAHQTRMIPLYSMHRIQINPPPPPPLSEELTLKPELAMLRIRTRRCALCLTLCDWEQQQPPRPDSWCNLTEPGRPACADAELQGQVHDALEQIVSCNHNLQQVHFSVVSCNHNLQQVHSSCISLVQSQPAAGALFCSLMQSQPAAGALFLCWYQHGIHTLQEKCTICRKVHLLQV